MMPNLGQGACQAIEDAYVLTEQLCDVTDKSQIPDALQRCSIIYCILYVCMLKTLSLCMCFNVCVCVGTTSSV